MVRTFNVKNNSTGDIIQLDFDAMTIEQLRNLENSVVAYRMNRVDEDIKKAAQEIYNFIAKKIRECPDLATRTAFITENEDYYEWGELLNMLG